MASSSNPQALAKAQADAFLDKLGDELAAAASSSNNVAHSSTSSANAASSSSFSTLVASSSNTTPPSASQKSPFDLSLLSDALDATNLPDPTPAASSSSAGVKHGFSSTTPASAPTKSVFDTGLLNAAIDATIAPSPLPPAASNSRTSVTAPSSNTPTSAPSQSVFDLSLLDAALDATIAANSAPANSAAPSPVDVLSAAVTALVARPAPPAAAPANPADVPLPSIEQDAPVASASTNAAAPSAPNQQPESSYSPPPAAVPRAPTPPPSNPWAYARWLREQLGRQNGAAWSRAFPTAVAPNELVSWGAILEYIGWLERHPLRAHVSDLVLVEWAASHQERGVMDWVAWGCARWCEEGAFANHPLAFLAHVMEAVRMTMADPLLVELAVGYGYTGWDAAGPLPLGVWLANNEEACGQDVLEILGKVWREWAGEADARMVDVQTGMECQW